MMRNGLLIEYLLAYGLGAAALQLSGAPLSWLAVWTAIVATPALLLSRIGPAAYALVRTATPVLLGAAFAAAYDACHATPAIRAYIIREVSEYSGEQYYAVTSTLFALLTALILVKGIEAFDRLNAVLGEEANKIRSIVEFMYYFEEEDGERLPDAEAVKARTRRIRKLMRIYCGACVADPVSADHDRANQLLRRSTQEVGALDCHDENDRLALAEVMRALNELFAIRARRVACSRAKAPASMMVALVFMSLALIFPFFIGAPEAHPYAKAYIFVLTAFCAFVLALLRDINTPFEGVWRVDMQGFHVLRRDLDRLLEPAPQDDAPAPRQPVTAALRRRGRTI